MKLVLFGANGPTGRLVAERALIEGHAVTAATRRPDTFPIQHPHLRVASVDALDLESVDGVVAGHDRVISILGTPYTKEPVRVFSQGAANILAAMDRHNLRRLVCVTSVGVHTDLPSQAGFLLRRLVGPILLAMGRTVYEDMRRMEQVVRATDLDWTIVRPSGLFDTTAVSEYHIAAAPERLLGLFTSRIDLADLLLHEALDDRLHHARTCLEVNTTQGTPSYVGVFLKEALHLNE